MRNLESTILPTTLIKTENVFAGGLTLGYSNQQNSTLDFLKSANAYQDYFNKLGAKIQVLEVIERFAEELDSALIATAIELHYDIKITGSERTRYLKANTLKYIFKKVQKKAIQQLELTQYQLGNVNDYASPLLTKIRIGAEEKQREHIKNTVLRNKRTGAEIALSELVQTPEAKAAELYLKAKSLEKKAIEKNYTFAFYTFTTPARMHANPAKGRNTWDGTTPTEAKDFLQECWAKSRAQLEKSDIDYFGLWAREPHKDGTPHMHALIYAETKDLAEIDRVMNYQFAHSKSAVKVVYDDGRAAPTSYITKYIMKSLGFDGESKDFKDGVKMRAAVLTWNYRRYNFFGVESKLSLWRECRKIDESKVTNNGLLYLIKSAKDNDWKSFIDSSEDYSLHYNHEINAYEETVAKTGGIVVKSTGELAYIKESVFEILTDSTLVTLNVSYPRDLSSTDLKSKERDPEKPLFA
jgi:hypothetical protein